MGGRQKVAMVNAGTPRLYPDFVAAFRNTIETTNTDLPQLLLTLSHYSRTIDLYGVLNTAGVSHQGFAVANYCLLTSFQPFPGFDTSIGKVYEDSRALSIVREAEGLQENWTRTQNSTIQKEQAKLSMVRTVADTGLFQQEVIYKVANTLVLSGIKPFRNLGVESNSVNFLFKKYVGISAYDYYLLLFSLWINTERTPIFNVEHVLSKVRRPKEIVDFGKKLCLELSKTPADYHHTKLDQQIESLSAKYRGSAYFSLHPLISMGNNFFACIAHPFLRTHITSKFIQKALALAREEEPTLEGRTSLSHFIGVHRLEEYFRELCDEWGPSGGHHDEFIYSKEMKSSDRIVFEDVDGVPFGTLIQLKLKSLPIKVHFAESWEEIGNDFGKSFADCVFKSIKFLYNLQKANTANQIDAKFRDLCSRILALENYCFLGVVPDLPPIFSICYAREALEAEVAKKVSKDKKLSAWFHKSFPDGYLWHIMDLTEFQFMLSTPKKTSLAKEICLYVNGTGVDSEPLQGDQTMPPSFKNFLISRYGTEKNGGGKRLSNFNPRLLSLFIEAKDDIGYFLFRPFFMRWARDGYFWIREVFRTRMKIF